MGNKVTSNQFREEEIVILRHWDKRDGKWVENSYPKVEGRLRLAHEGNEQLSITTEIVRYDENMAVVSAIAETSKGNFHGLGMASTDRDRTIAPAILELAETRAIARALRFAGYGVEYCSAEEISHLETQNPEPTSPEKKTSAPPKVEDKGGNAGAPNNGGEGGGSAQSASSNGGNGGNGQSGRITNKQLSFIVTLGKQLGLTSKDLDQKSVAGYGVKMAHLSVKEASAFIETLRSRTT